MTLNPQTGQTPKHPPLQQQKILFIGGGNMAQALIFGLIQQGINPAQITASEPNPSLQNTLQQHAIATFDPKDQNALDHAIDQADILILAIKPQVIAQAVADFADKLTDQLVLSIVAGVDVETLSRLLNGHQNLIRIMPNTPAMIQQGAAGLYAPAHITTAQKQLAETLISSTGLAIWVENEDQLHAVTAIAGSAPAYFFYLIENMIKSGQDLGLSPEQAHALATQTALGAAQMARQSQDNPTTLRQKVTSPNGTTQAAIETLDKTQVDQHLQQAMAACYQRSQEIGKELKQKT